MYCTRQEQVSLSAVVTLSIAMIKKLLLLCYCVRKKVPLRKHFCEIFASTAHDF